MYEKHRREYTIVGSTKLCGSIVGDLVCDFFGGQLSEIISLVQNKIYFHFQVVGEREAMARCLVERIKNGQVNLEKEYDNFYGQVKIYESFVESQIGNFREGAIVELFKYYDQLMPVALASIDLADVVEGLNIELKNHILDWCKKTRVIEESIYKIGEMKFVPAYLSWLSKTYLPEYTAEDLQYLIYFELENYLKNGSSLPRVDELRERAKLLFVRQHPVWKTDFCTGANAEKEILTRNLLGSPSDGLSEIKQITGKMAFAGKVTGRVRLIRSTLDMKDFQDGEIIVSPMTMPSYISIMKRAVAFVTNEGGILCHAAIVARELCKPCIIGAKIATHVLKDGDLVEVDADNGTITKF